ncbi:hypothetical protein N0V93_003749 [Gnomoniopsis smithogilvyi]|uniref:Zn(2)-C6 fungal-type domain-containing protein n=1 Tax=Gnomoniopsis smithogilvyi TaxID=1191159 RepID=A0A9W8YX80_9PEZI|nr:hypothetical protein N0V93_003749 [Gnomoniopsis smithogilvyi]
MDCFPFPRPGATPHSLEKSPESECHDDEGCSRTTIFQSIGNSIGNVIGSVCAPSSHYGPAPAYSTISPIYEASISHIYPADLQSPSSMSQHLNVSGYNPEMPRPPSLVDSANLPAFTEQHPILQPGPHTNMRYQALESGPKLETSPHLMKLEKPTEGEDFQQHNFHTRPAHMFSTSSSHSAPGIVQTDPGYYPQHSMARYQAQYPTSHGIICAEATQQQSFDYFLPSQIDEPEMTPTQKKPAATKRGPFKDPQKRIKTAQTRKMGSCIRCRMQRIRCEMDEDSPEDENAPCECCKKISANTKIHRMPCRRWKLIDVRLSKPGNVEGYDWTHRWKDSTAMPEITQWEDCETRSIFLCDGFISPGVSVKVRRFKAIKGDKLERVWYEGAQRREVKTGPWALVDVAAAKTTYDKYLSDAQPHIFKKLLGPREKLLWRTYECARLRRDHPATSLNERNLLAKTLDLWVAIRLTTTPFEIKGEETLGIRPADGKILLPPVMGKQLDKLLLDHTLTKLRRETLDVLQKMTQDKKQNTWLTTYLISFILLHNVALITKHDSDYARKHRMTANNDQSKMLIWARPEVVQQYHLGANILLAYFHYCNRGTYPFSKGCKESDLQDLAGLNKETISFVKWTRDEAELHKTEWQNLRERGFDGDSSDDGNAEKNAEAYSDPYFFVSQLYGKWRTSVQRSLQDQR